MNKETHKQKMENVIKQIESGHKREIRLLIAQQLIWASDGDYVAANKALLRAYGYLNRGKEAWNRRVEEE